MADTTKQEATARIAVLIAEANEKLALARIVAQEAGLNFNWELPVIDPDDEDAMGRSLSYDPTYGWDSSQLCW